MVVIKPDDFDLIIESWAVCSKGLETVMSLSLSVTELGNTCVLYERLFKTEKGVARERKHMLESYRSSSYIRTLNVGIEQKL